MKAVREAFEIALGIRLDQAEFVAGNIFERRALAFGLADQKPGNLIRQFEQPLGNADIDHQHIGHKLRLDAQRRQQRAVACQRRDAFCQLEFGKRLRRHQHFSRRRHERLQPCLPDRRRISHFRGEGDGLDTQ